MKIRATASGGFAGQSAHYELDTRCHRDGAAIEDLLARLDVFGAAPLCPVGADQVRWDITVDDGLRCRTLRLAEHELPPDAGWQALLGFLRA